ncbi:hypothetical protein [Schaalia sp. lx-260]|uniref:hypothetical protein n=1 Tax=Schaalia sp. lx-260 TaxID=2899082 RepID=UPI001E30F35A|nr:hypothetical protein [Schaalia sp. lx-260]MCD4549707.1 hypothetical protein [Schaalia sp. lx-260]
MKNRNEINLFAYILIATLVWTGYNAYALVALGILALAALIELVAGFVAQRSEGEKQ